MAYSILVINPGSTSTKLALYKDAACLWQENIEHDAGELKAYPTIYSQLDFRVETVRACLARHGADGACFDCVMARGGLLPPLPAGAYRVNTEMLEVLENRPMNHHASNLGAAIAFTLTKGSAALPLIYDPVTVDEMIPLVRLTGIKGVLRHGQGHNLNMRAAVLRYCGETGRSYNELCAIVAHLGGGITLSLHHRGRIIDMVSDDEGAFSSERSGLIPAFKLAKVATVEGMSYPKLMRKLQRESGLVSLIGQGDARKVEAMIAAGDKEAKTAYEAMALGVSQSIGRLAVDVEGAVDVIILTGGVANSKLFTGMIERRVRFIAPVCVMPGENEMQALAEGALRVLTGKEKPVDYHEPKERLF